LEIVSLCYSLLALVPAGLMVPFGLVPIRIGFTPLFWLLVCIPVAGAIATVAMYGAKTPIMFEIALLLKTVLVLALVWPFAGEDLVLVLLFSSLLLEIDIYHPFPWNLLICAVVLALFFVLRRTFLPSGNFSSLLDSIRQLDVLLVLFIQALAVGVLILYRELLIRTQKDNERLDQAMVRMNRANQEYHSYLLRVEKESTENERKRITRDIHDTVGYTLTNNIMLMEAATDMMTKDPLGVTGLINLARENAQEGLSRIRETLYKFRSQKSHPPNGLQAISKMVNIFQIATSVEVVTEYGNMPWTLGDELDSIVYHLIQESLMNSFRHGKAGRVRVLMSINRGTLTVRIHDNGQGAVSMKSGIGISGMGERIQKVHGTLKAGNVPYGFEVVAAIPLGENSVNGEKRSDGQ
jgi:signal transduction histidine kinase